MVRDALVRRFVVVDHATAMPTGPFPVPRPARGVPAVYDLRHDAFISHRTTVYLDDRGEHEEGEGNS